MTTYIDAPLVARTVDPRDDPLWRRLVVEHRTDIFHSPAWCATLADTYGYEPRACVLVDRAGLPVAGMPYVDVGGPAGARRLSLPFSDFCDPIVADGAHWSALVDAVAGGGTRLQLRCLRNDLPVADPRFTVTGRARWHVVDVAGGPEQLWERIDPAARRSIRKARTSGLDVRPARDRTDLRRFYELHLRVRKRKYGLLAQPFRLFEQIWDRLLAPGHGVLLLAWHGDRVVGGVLYLEWGDTLYYKFNASDLDQLSVRPNDLLAWSGIEEASRRGLRRLDFGLTDWEQEGLVRYKRKYATAEGTIHMVCTRTQDPQEDGRWRSDLRRVTALLVDDRVPDDLTEQAGDALYRYFA